MSHCLCAGILFADVACFPISHVPKAGELLPTEKIELNLGGCAANVAMNLTRLGVPVTLTGRVGDDAFSDFITQNITQSGVCTDYVQRSAQKCPGTAIHINVQNEDRRFICTTGANDDFVFDDRLIQLITAPTEPQERKILYLGGFFMLRGLENAELPNVLQTAKKHGWRIVLDVVLYGKRNYEQLLKPLLPFADYFMPNNDEAEIITGLKNVDKQAKYFLDIGAGSVLITMGENGVRYFDAQKRFHTAVYRTEYVSGSGAGDAFCAGLIAGLLDGQCIEDAVKWGSAAGASCVRGISTTGTVFNRQELLEFLDTLDSTVLSPKIGLHEAAAFMS